MVSNRRLEAPSWWLGVHWVHFRLSRSLYVKCVCTVVYTVYIYTHLRDFEYYMALICVGQKWLWHGPSKQPVRSGTPISMEDRLLVWNWQCFCSLEMISNNEVEEAQKKRKKIGTN